jgi:rhamnulokinase
MGAEVSEPCLTARALEVNFTNEGGVFGTWRLSKNIMGLWLVQECRRTWAHQGDNLSYDEITRLANEARPFLAVIDPDDSKFLHPGNMPERIQEYCADTHQVVPSTRGEIIRVALESIALKYRWVLERLEELGARQFSPIHIIGGGIKNRLLNQFAADATKRPVITGPVEATAIGNALMQAIGLGHLNSLGEARRIVRASFELDEYQPQHEQGWDEGFAKLNKLMDSGN